MDGESVVVLSMDGESVVGVEAGPVVRLDCCSSAVSVAETAVVDGCSKETEESAGLLTENVN